MPVTLKRSIFKILFMLVFLIKNIVFLVQFDISASLPGNAIVEKLPTRKCCRD